MQQITQFLHFDSIYAKYQYDVNNTSGEKSGAYKCIFPMHTAYRNVSRCYLKTLELPIGFSNIRKGSTDTFKFILNGTTHTVTLAPKNYSSIQSLFNDLNAKITTSIIGSGATMVVSLLVQSLLNTNYLKITFTGTTTFSIIDTNLSKYILGLRGNTDSLSIDKKQYTALSSIYNLNADNYIYVYVPTLNGQNACMGSTISTFKIPLNATEGQVYYYQSGSSYEQFVDITNRGLVISSMEVTLIDRYGNNLNSMGLDWSMTLSLVYDY